MKISVPRGALWSVFLGPLFCILSCPSSIDITIVTYKLAAWASFRRMKFTPGHNQKKKEMMDTNSFYTWHFLRFELYSERTIKNINVLYEIKISLLPILVFNRINLKIPILIKKNITWIFLFQLKLVTHEKYKYRHLYFDK